MARYVPLRHTHGFWAHPASPLSCGSPVVYNSLFPSELKTTAMIEILPQEKIGFRGEVSSLFFFLNQSIFLGQYKRSAGSSQPYLYDLSRYRVKK